MTEIEKKKITVEVRKEEFYQHFIEECQAIKVESMFISAMELIKGKWELGKRISEEELRFGKAGYGEGVMRIIAEDLNMSLSHVYKCVQFYNKYKFKEFEKVQEVLPGGKNISWYKLSQKFLIEKSQGEEEIKKEGECIHSKLRCVKCEKEMNLNEVYEYCKGKENKKGA